jgi:tetratricopeptide (TPR) repeat protein
MKRGKSHKTNPADSSIKAAHINGRYKIIVALITVFGAIIVGKNTIGSKSSQQQVSPATGGIEGELLPKDESMGSFQETIHIVLPEPEKPHPQAAYRHNANAKQLLDKIIMLPDKEIKPLLDKVFIELAASHRVDDEFGETYYFYGVAYIKLGDYYIAINNISQAIFSYDESLNYFDKSEHLYSHRSNTYFDRGRTYHIIASIYQRDDSEKAKENRQKAIDDFNKALDNDYAYPENVYFAMGIIYYETEEYQRAKECYTDALKTANDKYRPIRAEIYFNRSNVNFRLGMSCFLRGDYENAVQYYEESINDNHENFSAHFELGKTYTFQKRWLDAVRKFKFILEQKPKKFDLETVADSLKYASSMIE